MFEAFVIMLREGVEAALVVCIALAFLSKSGRQSLKRYVYLGIAAATLAAIGAAVAIKASGFDPETEWLEGSLLLVSSVMVLSLLVWMWKAGKHMKAKMETRLGEIADSPKARAGVFAFTFFMVGREGMEAVLFLAAVDLTTQKLLAAIGALAGLAVAIGLAIALYRGSLRVHMGKFFTATGIVLVIFVAQLFVGGIHEFMEAGYIPSSHEIMAIVGPIVKSNAIFVIAVLVLPFFMLLTSSVRSRTAEDPTRNAAEGRKRRAARRAQWTAKIAFSSLAIVAIVALGADRVYMGSEYALTPPTMVTARGGEVTVPLSTIKDGHLYRFGFDTMGKRVRFLVYRTKKGVHTSLDACEICGDMGYVQKGKEVICRNCLAAINAATIGRGGGCNPLPLPATVTGKDIEIPVSELAAAAPKFHQAAPSVARADPVYTCPVCHMRFHASDEGGVLHYHGLAVPYCKMPGCRRRLLADPGKYLTEKFLARDLGQR